MSTPIGRALESLADRLSIAADDILLIREAAAILNGDDMTTKSTKVKIIPSKTGGRTKVEPVVSSRQSVSAKIAARKSPKTKVVRRTP